MKKLLKGLGLTLGVMGISVLCYLPAGALNGSTPRPDDGQRPAPAVQPAAIQPATMDCLRFPIEGRQSCTKDSDCPSGQACVDSTCVMAACAPGHGELALGITGDTLRISTR